jgi:hypothetical protein
MLTHGAMRDAGNQLRARGKNGNTQGFLRFSFSSAQNMVLGVAFFMTVFPVQPSLLVKQKCAALKARPEIDKIRIVLDLDLRVGGPKYLLLKRVSRALYRAIAASVKKHNERVKQISKFRPAAEYAGARELRGDMKLILAPGAIAEPASGSSSAQQRSPRRPEWQHLSPHDVRRHRWITDRSVRSVFTRDEDEVLSEAAETFKHSDVTVQRLTWSDIGKQVAANLSPSRRGSKQLSNTARSTNSSTGPNNHHGTSYKQIQASPREQQQTCTSGTMGTTFGSGMILPALPPPPSSSSSSSRHPTGRGAPQPQQQDPSVEQPHRPQLQEQHNEDRGDTTRRPPTQEEGSSARKPAAPQLPSSTILSASGRKKPTGGDSAHIPVPPASSGSSQQGRRRSSVSKDNAASASSSRHPTHSIDKDLKVFQDGDLYVVST